MTHSQQDPTERTPYGTPAAQDDQSTAGQAKDAAKDVAAHGKQQAADVAETGKQAAGEVVEQTKQQASDLLGKTRGQLRDQVESQRSTTIENLRSLGDQLASMTDNTDQDGTAVDVAGRARDRARSAADWLDNRDPDQILDEVRRFGRQRPGAFLLGAAVAGVVAGRLTRGVMAEHVEDTTSGSSTGTTGRTTAQPGPATTPAVGSDHVPQHDSAQAAPTRPAPSSPSTYARGEYRR